MCIFLATFGMHEIACVYFYHGTSFSRCDNIFNLALPFPDRFDEMGSLIRFMWDDQIRFETEKGGSPN